jgi:hypothetical protein
MGISLTYEPAGDLGALERHAVLADAQQLAESREWWCEPVCFLDPETLAGDTKIFLPGYTTKTGEYVKVTAEDDALMAAYDAKFILRVLTGWSKRYGFDWNIGVEGEPVGIVSPDGPNPELLSMIAMIASNGASDTMPEFDEREIQRIRAKYASRL